MFSEESVLLFGESHNHVVIERIDVVFPGLFFEYFFKFFEFFGVFFCQVSAFGEVLSDVVEFPLVLFEWQYDIDLPSNWLLRGLVRQDHWRGWLGVLDRAGLIALVTLTTWPESRPYMQWLAACGMLVLLVVYVLRGTFCFVVEDAFKKAEEDHERLVTAAGTQPYFPRVIETKPYGSFDR